MFDRTAYLPQAGGDANAIYRIGRRILFDTEIFDEFMEVFHEYND